MFALPVGFGDPVQKNCQKFFEYNIHAVIAVFFAIYKGKGPFGCVIRIEEPLYRNLWNILAGTFISIGICPIFPETGS